MIEKVVNICSYLFMVDPKDVVSASQKDVFVFIRGMVCYILMDKSEDKYTYAELGAAMGGKNHATMSVCKARFQAILSVNLDAIDKINAIINLFIDKHFDDRYLEILMDLERREREEVYIYKTLDKNKYAEWSKEVLYGDGEGNKLLVEREIAKLNEEIVYNRKRIKALNKQYKALSDD